MYATILIVIHVLGAVVGIGPTYAFSIIGPNAGKVGGEGAIALLDTLLDIEKKIVTPVALFLQPLTGVLLIFESERNRNFFSHEWLWIAIVIYAALLYLSYIVDNPAIHRVVKGMREGTAGTPEWNKSLQTTQKLGPLLGVLGVVIVILMVWKPGDIG